MIAIGPVEFSFNDEVTYYAPGWQAQPGELIYLSGCNGSGKSSYLKGLITTLAPLPLSYVSHNIPQALSLSLGFLAMIFSLFRQGSTLPSSTPYDDLRLSSLSAGQQRLFLLKNLLSTQSTLWIIDEGWIHLDPSVLKFIRKRIEQYLSQGGIVIYTDHNSSLELPVSQTLEITARTYAIALF